MLSHGHKFIVQLDSDLRESNSVLPVLINTGNYGTGFFKREEFWHFGTVPQVRLCALKKLPLLDMTLNSHWRVLFPMDLGLMQSKKAQLLKPAEIFS